MMSYSSCMHVPEPSDGSAVCDASACSIDLLHEAKLQQLWGRSNKATRPAGPRCTKRQEIEYRPAPFPFALHPRSSFRIGVTACVIFFRPRSYHPITSSMHMHMPALAHLHLILHASLRRSVVHRLYLVCRTNKAICCAGALSSYD